MEQIIEMCPAYDKRDHDPTKNYGVHGVELRMILKGDKGAAQFVLYTNWMTPEVTKEMRNKMTPSSYFLFEPMPADLGIHALEPLYEGQESRPDCPYLDGRPCYYDGSTLNAKNIFDVLCNEGSEGVWRELQQFYDEHMTSDIL